MIGQTCNFRPITYGQSQGMTDPILGRGGNKEHGSSRGNHIENRGSSQKAEEDLPGKVVLGRENRR